MNNQRSHGMLMPGASRLKRKEREPFYPAKRSPIAPPPEPERLPRATVTTSTTVTTLKGSKGMEVMSSNQLLAGYMAYEFLSKGTLLGNKFDPARAETAARGKSKYTSRSEAEMDIPAKESYKEITSLVMMKNEGGIGVHIPGIVNPTQLARWIKIHILNGITLR